MIERIVIVVALVACGGSKSKPAPISVIGEPVTCGAVADGMIAMMLADKEPRPGKEIIDDLTKLIANRCEQDAWTTDARQCLAAMKSQADAERCSALLTDEQQANLVADQKAKFGGPPAEGAEPAPAPAAAPPPDRARDAPKGAKSPKTSDPCDGGE